jgi:DNA-binding MarR family transcriptional regulator
MQKNNLVKRIESKDDLRLKQLILTEVALKKINILVDKIVKFDKSLEKNISKKDLEVFYKVTEQIKNNIINGEE